MPRLLQTVLTHCTHAGTLGGDNVHCKKLTSLHVCCKTVLIHYTHVSTLGDDNVHCKKLTSCHICCRQFSFSILMSALWAVTLYTVRN